MINKSTIPALVAAIALGGAGAAFAGDAPSNMNKAGSYGAGVASTTPHGATAAGVGGSEAMNATRGKNRGGNHHDRRAGRAAERGETANSATTYGSGAVTTTRDSANAAVTSGGSASGSGVQSTGSTVDAYGETTRDGSNADIYGNSTATSGARAR
ncbi:MAG: hypothetical protein Q8R82_22970 [Hyphomonadaceae bacterium]|nr:hypothetical protein [Hyphomonadaceae bacterium]